MKLKSYLAIAKAIKENSKVPTNFGMTYDNDIHREPFVKALCDILEADNPKFNRAKFLESLK